MFGEVGGKRTDDVRSRELATRGGMEPREPTQRVRELGPTIMVLFGVFPYGIGTALCGCVRESYVDAAPRGA